MLGAANSTLTPTLSRREREAETECHGEPRPGLYHSAMAAGRSSKPLFEYLHDQARLGRRDASSPAPVPVAMPAASPVSVPAQNSTPRAAPAPMRPSPQPRVDQPTPIRSAAERLWSGSTLSISRPWVVTVVAIGVLGLILAYSVGHSAGRTKGQQDMARSTGAGLTGPITEPLRKATGLPPGDREGVRTDGADRSKPTPPPKPDDRSGKNTRSPVNTARDDDSRPIILSNGSADVDPRKPGLNYLVIATRLPRDKARELVEFLGENGIEAAGVYVPPKVDPGGGSGNTSGSYKVAVLAGVTRDQHRSNDPARSLVESEVRRAAPLWKKAGVGHGDITQWYWELLVSDEH